MRIMQNCFAGFAYDFALFALYYTNSIIAILLASPLRGGNFTILVYPPFFSLYFGAIWSNNFFADSIPILEIINRLLVRLSILALVINFSINGLNSFAFAPVVLIFSLSIKLQASDLIKARLWSLFLPNFLPTFLCFTLILIHNCPRLF